LENWAGVGQSLPVAGGNANQVKEENFLQLPPALRDRVVYVDSKEAYLMMIDKFGQEVRSGQYSKVINFSHSLFSLLGT
jgi:hypothetical protein